MKAIIQSSFYLKYIVCVNSDEEALDVIQIAHKYQLNGVTEQCQNILNQWIPDCNPTNNSHYRDSKLVCSNSKPVDNLLRILTVADRIQMKDLISSAVKILAKFNHEHYTGGVCTCTCNGCGGTIGNKRYAALNVKHDILLARLKLVDDRKDR